MDTVCESVTIRNTTHVGVAASDVFLAVQAPVHPHVRLLCSDKNKTENIKGTETADKSVHIP